MRKLKADLDRLKAILEEKNPGGAEALRFAEVNDLWRNAVGAVFGGDSADLVLDHTNSVYVISSTKSSAPASRASIISSSESPSYSSLSTTICPFLSNMKDTQPGVPTFPLPFVNAFFTLEAVRFLLSVSASTMIAVPFGP